MKKDPLVSIIIPCYNKVQYVSDAIESALNQTYSNIELILVDDGSTDNTCEIIKKYQVEDARVRYFYKENGGVSSARNYGIRQAQGEWVQFLDADDWLNKDKINFQLKYSVDKKYHDGVVFYSDYKIIDEGSVYEGTEFTFENLDNEQLIKKLIGRKFGLSTPTPLHVNSTLFSKNLFETELFDETVPLYEEIILFYNLLIKNVQFVHTPCIGMYYRSNPGGISKNEDSVKIGYLQFLETVYSTRREYLEYSPNIGKLIKYFIKRRNKEMYNRTLNLIRISNIPVYSYDNKNIREMILILDKFKILYPLVKYRRSYLINYPKL